MLQCVLGQSKNYYESYLMFLFLLTHYFHFLKERLQNFRTSLLVLSNFGTIYDISEEFSLFCFLLCMMNVNLTFYFL